MTVNAPAGVALGAAVLQIQGRGVRSFSGVGATQTFGEEPGAGDVVHRVVLVAPGGPLTFRIDVADLGTGPPAAAVITAADDGNRAISPVGFEVTFALAD